MKVIGIISKDTKIANKIGYYLGVGATAMTDIRSKKYDNEDAMKFDWFIKVGNLMNQPLAPDKNNIDSFALHANNYCGDKVNMETFAHTLQFMVAELTSIPVRYFIDCNTKKDYVINIKTFEYRKIQPEDVLMNPYELYDKMQANADFTPVGQEIDDAWMTLNSYVVYFGQCVCRTFLGKDVWTRVEERMNRAYPPEDDTVRIYTDMKSMSEYEYIRSIGGKVVSFTGIESAGSYIYDDELDNVPADITFYVDDNGEIVGNVWEIMYDMLKGIII